jgi:hypothetical protein
MHKHANDSKKKKILIHIGMGRCGSSSIQHALRIKRSELASKGILYPETNPIEDGHHVLGLLSDKKLEEAQRGWMNVITEFEKSRCTTLLVSTELLIGISPKLFEFIKGVISHYFVEIIFITRNQRELLPSIYAQWIKAGIVFTSFQHFYNVTKKEWHFTNILERWSDAYGIGNIKCGILRPNGDAIQLFSECSGEENIGNILKDTRIRINGGINPTLLSTLVFFDKLNSRNKIGETFPGWNEIEPSCPERNSAMRERLVGLLEKQTKGWIGKGRWKLGHKMEMEIVDEYMGTNSEFHSKYLGLEPKNWFI